MVRSVESLEHSLEPLFAQDANLASAVDVMFAVEHFKDELRLVGSATCRGVL